MKKMKTISVQDIKIIDDFWDKYRRLVKEEILPYQWNAMNDKIEGAAKSHCIENFRIAAGEKEGEFYGAVFQDSDAAKWLEATAYVLAEEYDEKLKKLADSLIDLLEKAQQSDGYFNTYFILKAPDQRFKNLREGHELYTLGHMIEAAVAYTKATGEDRFLCIVEKMVDLVEKTFGSEEGKIHGMPGHQEIELALMKLYDWTGIDKYKKLAKYFIDVRGTGEENYFLKEMGRNDVKAIFPELRSYIPEYSQSHCPVRKQETAEGHAVRAVYMYAAMADIAAEYDDEELFLACEKLWDNITKKRMYVTGGIGSSGILERFTTDYDLPNAYNYSETCASIGLALFSQRMMQITQDAKYIDVVEKALYNTILSGIGMDGRSFFYVNPLEVWPPSCMGGTSKEHVKSNRQKWFGVACCPANVSRTLASLGEYIYAYNDDTIFINLFIGNNAHIQLKKGAVHIELRTNFPWENGFEVCINPCEQECKLALRIPQYASKYTVMSDGEKIAYERKKEYAIISCKERKTYYINFTAEPCFIRANPKVREDAGKVCVMRGPLVYAAEEVDNGENLSKLYIDTTKEIQVIEDREYHKLRVFGKKILEDNWSEEELYGTHPLKTEVTKIDMIPYAYWNNRGEGEMSVWMKEA